jgi:hypothetical protein
MRRLLGTAVMAAVALTPLAEGQQASADPLCIGVQNVGSSGPPLATGPICIPYAGSTNCQVVDVGLSPTLIIRVLLCLPH